MSTVKQIVYNYFFGNEQIDKNKKTRDNWVISKLQTFTKDKSILDAGAGEQKYKEYCAHLKYISQDFCQYDGKGNNIGLQTGEWDIAKIDIVSDITSIPSEDESFDYIMCTEVFEHISEPIKAIEEFARILKPGGELLLTAPFGSLTHFAPYHYYSGFNRYFYEELLPKYGLIVEEVVPNGNYFDFILQEMNRLPYMSTQYVGERLSLLEKICIGIINKRLSKFTSKALSSSEVACFGFHVLAKKSKGASNDSPI